MRRKIALFLTAVMAVLSLAGCGGKSDEQAGEDKVYKIAFVVPYIGDQSYWDLVDRGRQIVEEYENVETTLIEAGEDTSKWTSVMTDVCESGYDLIVSGNDTYEYYLYEAAEKYPDQLFFNFDFGNPLDYDNVYAVKYDTAELGYVAGLLSCIVTSSDMEQANEDKVIGVIVGMENDAMDDFIGGYCQAANDMGVQVIIGYPESWTDVAKAKEMTLNMINSGADVIWQVAGGAGNGVFEACAEQNVYALGVDQDQYAQFIDSKPEYAKTILTSFVKNAEVGVQTAVDKLIAGEFPGGAVENLGIAKNGVGLVENDYYLETVPEEVRNQVAEALERVTNGEIEVFSVLNGDPTEWQEIKSEAQQAK
ncbi:BMP family ABC transporter substrate-binding protein [Candidatus Merdisoma sp. JLR.KK011]|uniref:BMP family lipoprotein n=1 Tax=Candidatus Merdisoma sp. JLR.KK011 TaxID=3114299 RepID=UPI002FF350EE